MSQSVCVHAKALFFMSEPIAALKVVLLDSSASLPQAQEATFRPPNFELLFYPSCKALISIHEPCF